MATHGEARALILIISLPVQLGAVSIPRSQPVRALNTPGDELRRLCVYAGNVKSSI